MMAEPKTANNKKENRRKTQVSIFSRQASLTRQAFLITALHGARSKMGKNAYTKSSAM